jgi:hypothetical protein
VDVRGGDDSACKRTTHEKYKIKTKATHKIDEGRLEAAGECQLGEGGVGHAEILGAQRTQHLGWSE